MRLKKAITMTKVLAALMIQSPKVRKNQMEALEFLLTTFA